SLSASPLQSSVRTAAAMSPDVRTGLKHSARSARLREARYGTYRIPDSDNSAVRTAVSGAATPKKASRSRSNCTTVHTATANYEIDLRQRSSNSITGPTTNVSTARTISPAKSADALLRSRYDWLTRRTTVIPVRTLDYPPLPSEGDPAEERIELAKDECTYTPHISRPILLGDGVRTARAHTPTRTRTLSERTALGDTSLNTGRSLASKSQT
ncbi:hypothetical protein PMAYCL1PPCAC_05515, partial [Pristionchus mayeri]